MTENLDRDLARRFAELARADEASAPGFRAVLRRAPTAPHSIVRSFALAVAVAAAVSLGASVLWISRAARERPISAAPLAEWQSPTSALLETPGRDLLASTPDLGVSEDGSASPVPAKTPSAVHSKGASS